MVCADLTGKLDVFVTAIERLTMCYRAFGGAALEPFGDNPSLIKQRKSVITYAKRDHGNVAPDSERSYDKRDRRNVAPNPDRLASLRTRRHDSPI